MLHHSPAQLLALLPERERQAWIAERTPEELAGLRWHWPFWARPDQIAPQGEWDIWLALAGRGWGKTRAGAEWVRQEVESGKAKRIALIAETAADARDVMTEGPSGILAVHPEATRPEYEPSKRRLTWPNGATATLFNATEPDQLRGPQFDLAWCDELAKWRYARETWDQLQFGLRLGDHPRVMVTTTPRPIELVKAILAGQEGKVTVTRGKTMDNAANLAAPFMAKIKARYEGTRLGRQELDAEVLGDLPGALWSMATLDAYRLPSQPDFKRIVVAVDPAVSDTEQSDEHGIIVAGIDEDGRGIVLEDASMKGGPAEWSRRVVSLYRSWGADAVVVERNQGGDMVAHTIRTAGATVNIREVTASRGKHIRAEPIAALYEQGRVAHVGAFPALESQMTQMTSSGYQGDGSPDRLDALVWALTDLFPDMVEPVRNIAPPQLPRMAGGWMSA